MAISVRVLNFFRGVGTEFSTSLPESLSVEKSELLCLTSIGISVVFSGIGNSVSSNASVKLQFLHKGSPHNPSKSSTTFLPTAISLRCSVHGAGKDLQEKGMQEREMTSTGP